MGSLSCLWEKNILSQKWLQKKRESQIWFAPYITLGDSLFIFRHKIRNFNHDIFKFPLGPIEALFCEHKWLVNLETEID